MAVNNNTDVWQNEGAFIFKLRDTGKVRRVDGVLQPVLENEWSMRLNRTALPEETGAANAMKEVFMAEQLVKLLNSSN